MAVASHGLRQSCECAALGWAPRRPDAAVKLAVLKSPLRYNSLQQIDGPEHLKVAIARKDAHARDLA